MRNAARLSGWVSTSWLAPGLAAAGTVLVASVCARGWPEVRDVRYLLGSGATSVVELDARWSDESTGESIRDASFRYDRGGAPRVVHHEPGLADGRYALAVTVVTVDSAGVRRITDLVEHVAVAAASNGGQLSFDLAPTLARADDPLPPRRQAAP